MLPVNCPDPKPIEVQAAFLLTVGAFLLESNPMVQENFLFKKKKKGT